MVTLFFSHISPAWYGVGFRKQGQPRYGDPGEERVKSHAQQGTNSGSLAVLGCKPAAIREVTQSPNLLNHNYPKFQCQKSDLNRRLLSKD